ncbi:MAG: hypothetical protein CVU17_00400 [Betaproteobacteria bacterium HGW-Betaproteobacteria-11]|nr:MAG: hypothetical protein CVU17_00400 [Betaproteobacteria bacterium HGW-Betaproteobacteria-11]
MNNPSDPFTTLEHKLDRLLALMDNLRLENAGLRARVNALESEKNTLEQKIATACARLEALRDQLPAS